MMKHLPSYIGVSEFYFLQKNESSEAEVGMY